MSIESVPDMSGFPVEPVGQFVLDPAGQVVEGFGNMLQAVAMPLAGAGTLLAAPDIASESNILSPQGFFGGGLMAAGGGVGLLGSGFSNLGQGIQSIND